MKSGDLHRHIGRAVRVERSRQHVSQEAFADRIGMHRTAFGAFERGEKDFQFSTLQRVADGLQVPASTLIESAEATLHTPDRFQR
jgi:transcriptional regulator with XRE-family HTH domain